MSIVFQTLKQLGYPMFSPKLKEVTGTEHLPDQGGYVIAANHIDWLDGFYIAAAVGQARNVPVHFLTKSNNYWWTTVAIQIPDSKPDTIINTAVDHLKQGKVICNFPEGQRNTTTELLPGKTGTIRMAASARVPVIPLGIIGRSGKNMAQSLLRTLSNNDYVSMHIGPPMHIVVPPTGMTKQFLADNTDQLMRMIGPLAGKTVAKSKE